MFSSQQDPDQAEVTGTPSNLSSFLEDLWKGWMRKRAKDQGDTLKQGLVALLEIILEA